MQKYRFTFTGFTPLLMHADNIEAADALSEWRKAPGNKGVSKAGDDRSPAWTWQSYLYHDGNRVVFPSENVMVALRQAGAQIVLKKQKTFKELSQTGLLISTENCEFLCGGKPLQMAEITAMRDDDFETQCAKSKKLGFELFMKRARIGTSKNIRVRPKFAQWTIRGEVLVTKQELTADVLLQLFDLAGKAGFGDWRPSGKTPGYYGQADSQIEMSK